MRLRSFKRMIGTAVTVVLVVVLAGPVLAEGESTARSILVPGSGQAQEGHYGKAAIFAGAAVVTGVGWFLSQVHFNQAVTRYNDLREIYVGYPDELQSGSVIPGSAIQQTYAEMTTAWDTSEDRQVWRNVFMVSFLAVYTVKRANGRRTNRPARSVSKCRAKTSACTKPSVFSRRRDRPP